VPLYEYSCEQCEHTFEALVLSQDEVVECPSCHSAKLKRQWGVPARPRTQGAALPMSGCATDLPPCGPGCCRIQRK
jgi:putative FmdB family regulatory protein